MVPAPQMATMLLGKTHTETDAHFKATREMVDQRKRREGYADSHQGVLLKYEQNELLPHTKDSLGMHPLSHESPDKRARLKKNLEEMTSSVAALDGGEQSSKRTQRTEGRAHSALGIDKRHKGTIGDPDFNMSEHAKHLVDSLKKAPQFETISDDELIEATSPPK